MRGDRPARGVLADGLLLAAGTFTTVRVAAPSVVDRPRAQVAMLLAPLAALPLGAAAALVAALGSAVGLPALITGALAVVAIALGTRALHLDGLADTVDGLAAPYDRPRRLAIMKSGDVGPAGVVALALALLVQAAGLGAVASRPYGWLLVAVLVCVSRAAVVAPCASPVPPATAGGLGAAVARSVPVSAAVGTAVAATAVVGLASAAGGAPWWQGSAAVLVAAGVVVLLVRRAVTLLGGITGDVVGACVEVALTVLCVVVAAG